MQKAVLRVRRQRAPFSEEQSSTLEESVDKQNDRAHEQSSEGTFKLIPKVERGYHPASVMVW